MVKDRGLIVFNEIQQILGEQNATNIKWETSHELRLACTAAAQRVVETVTAAEVKAQELAKKVEKSQSRFQKTESHIGDDDEGTVD